MARRKAPEDLSVEELRKLLIEKRRGARQERLEHFRRTGRVVDVPTSAMDSAPVVETPDAAAEESEAPDRRDASRKPVQRLHWANRPMVGCTRRSKSSYASLSSSV